ncbi:MAG TPA: phytanoyl-CoA dioxygenase family protein [Fimbriimonadaceae bacterium]|nr:phytanoyl-CoA dioxygenase family protein [Fimbriimonadaceae bacterium]
MRHEVTEEQIGSYRERGFVVIDGFLDSAELEEWRRCTEEAVKVRIESTPYLHNQSTPGDYYSQVFLQALKLADVHEGMRKLMHDRRLGRLAAELAGVGGIRIWHDQALIKPPFGNPTAWHCDNPFWSFSSADAISLWVALDDATLSNGCLWYLPGTHRMAGFDPVGIGANQRDLFKRYPEWLEIEPVACDCRAGSAVLHNGLTAHGAGANMTNRPRRAMTCAYMPDGSTFNGVRNVLPQAYFDSLSVGAVLDDDTVTPLIYRAG